MRNKVWSRVSLLIVIGLVVGALAACGPGEVAPVGEIEHAYVYDLGDFTGPYAAVTIDMLKGRQDFFKYTNDRGGINGKQIKFVWTDDNNQMARTMATYKRFMGSTPRPAFIIIGGTPTGEMFLTIAEKDKVVLYQYGGVSEAQIFPPRWNWFICPSYPEIELALDLWYLENRHEGDGQLKVCHIGQDNPFGKANHEAILRWAEESGEFEVGSQQFTAPAAADVTPQLIALYNEGCDLVCNQGNLATTTTYRDWAKLGYQEEMKMSNTCWSSPATTLVSTGAEIIEGYLFAAFTYMPEDTEEPGVQLAFDIRDEYRPGYEVNNMYLVGLAHGDSTVEIIKRAEEIRGGADIIGEDIMAAMKTMKGWSGNGFIPPFGGPTNENDRRLATKTRIYEVRDGKQAVASDWIDMPHIVPQEFRYLFPGEFK